MRIKGGKIMFAQRLRSRMAEQDMSQKELAEASGLSRAGISQYVHGKNKPGAKAIKAIAAALDAPVAYFENEPETTQNPSSVQLPKRLKTAQAAELMGVCPEMIRINLQNGRLPFGYAMQGSGGKNFSYFISTRKFMEYTGMTEQDILNVL